MKITSAAAITVLAVLGVGAHSQEAAKPAAAPVVDPQKDKEYVAAGNAQWHRIHDEMKRISLQEQQETQEASKRYAEERRAIHEKYRGLIAPLQAQLQQLTREHMALALKEGWVKAGTPQGSPKAAPKRAPAH
jgi:hypothetical protein